jgi:hypothetical protein
MAGEFEKEPESTRARLAQLDNRHEYQQGQYGRIAQDPRTRTLEQHEDMLRGCTTSPNGDAARVAYMREHRLRYEVGGRLVQDPPTATMNAAANQRLLLDAQAREMAMGARFAEPEPWAAQAPHHSGKAFSRTEILTSLKDIMASKGGIAEAITAFENLE